MVGEADVIEEQNNNNENSNGELDDAKNEDDSNENSMLPKNKLNTTPVDDSITNSSTSDDSGIFSSSNVTYDSPLATPNTSPPRRPIYSAERKEERVQGDTSKAVPPSNETFGFEYKQTKKNILKRKCFDRTLNDPLSPGSNSSSSSDDSSMLDVVSRAAIYDEIYKLDD